MEGGPSGTFLDAGGFGPFVTWAEYAAADGALVHWESRRQAEARTVPTLHIPRQVPRPGWDPGARGWAAGHPLRRRLHPSSRWGAVAWVLLGGGESGGDSITFFVGSVFFHRGRLLAVPRKWWTRRPAGTSQGLAPIPLLRRSANRLVGNRRPSWWARLFFKREHGQRQYASISAPDPPPTTCGGRTSWGRSAFLVASALAWFEVCPRMGCLADLQPCPGGSSW